MSNVQALPAKSAPPERPKALFLCKTCKGGERLPKIGNDKPVCKECGNRGMVLR